MAEKYQPPSWGSVWNQPLDPQTAESKADFAKWQAQNQRDNNTALWQRFNSWSNSQAAYEAFKQWEQSQQQNAATEAKGAESLSQQPSLSADNVKNIGR